jgi:hypothetical protein
MFFNNDPSHRWVTVFGHIVLLSTLTLIYILAFWNLPMSEDAGYYALLSKYIAEGGVLHRYLPASTNSLWIYITSFIFKLTGPNLDVYRTIHSCSFILLVQLTYYLVSISKNLTVGFIAALLSLFFIGIPDITLDLGINYIWWSLCFILLGLISKIRFESDFFFGFFWGLAAITRETFLLLGIAYIIFKTVELIRTILNKQPVLYSNELKFVSGYFSALAIMA